MTNTTPVLIYLTPVSLCPIYSFLYDLLLNHPQAFIGFVEKRLFEILELSSLSILKK